jgi:hypothetical protein
METLLNSGNACYHSVKNFFSYLNLNIRFQNTVTLPSVLFGRENWCLIVKTWIEGVSEQGDEGENIWV